MLFRKKAVSIDIGSHSVKVAQLREARGGVRGIRCAEEPLPPGFHWEAGGDNTALLTAIRTAMARAGIRARALVMSLPRRHVTARVSTFPPADKAHLRRVVEMDLADNIPFPVEQVVMDFQPLGPSREQAGLTDVLVVAAQREFVRQYLELARALRLPLVALTVDALAVHDLVRSTGEGPPGITLAAEIGHRAATINVSQGGRLWLTRSVALGGEQLTSAIAADLGVTAESAEGSKTTEGLRVLERGPRPHRVAAWVENLCGELRRSALSFGQVAMARIFLLGAGSRVPGLAEAIEKDLGVAPITLTVQYLFPQAWVRVATSAQPTATAAEGLAGEVGNAFSCLVAIGQGLRAVGRSASTISLIPSELLQQRRARRTRFAAAVAGVCVVGGMAAGYQVAAKAIRSRSAEYGKLKQSQAVAEQQQRQITELTATRDGLRAQVRGLVTAPRTRQAALELLRVISEAARPEVRLLSFSMEEEQPLVIRGTAPDPGAVVDMQVALEQSPLVTEVTVERAERVYERPARFAGPRMAGRTPAEAPRLSESVSFVIKARLWTKPKQRVKAAALARPGGQP